MLCVHSSEALPCCAGANINLFFSFCIAKMFWLNIVLAFPWVCKRRGCNFALNLLCMHFVQAGDENGHEQHRKRLREKRTTW